MATANKRHKLPDQSNSNRMLTRQTKNSSQNILENEKKSLRSTSKQSNKGRKRRQNVSEEKKLHCEDVTNPNGDKETISVHKWEDFLQCGICEHTFSTSNSLLTHVNSHHMNLKPYKCGFCDASFLVNDALLYHVSKEHKDLLSVYKCKCCSRVFDQISLLKIHISEHYQKNLTIRCDHCGLYFTHEKELTSHLQLHTQNDSLVDHGNDHLTKSKQHNSQNVEIEKVEFINKNEKGSGETESKQYNNENGELLNQTSLTEYKTKKHNVKNATAINQIDSVADVNVNEIISDSDENVSNQKHIKRKIKTKMVSKTKKNIAKKDPRIVKKDTEMLIVTNLKVDPDTKNKIYDCDVCGKQLHNSDGFVEHRKEHFTDGKFSIHCKHCTSEFNSFEALCQHIGPDKCVGYMCKICEKSFPLEPLLLTHQFKEHDHQLKQSKSFTCTICDKTFENKTAYFRHASSHAEDKSFHCKLCEHTFTTQETLFCHMRTYHFVISITRQHYKFNCELCKSQFIKSEALVNHKSIVHKVEDTGNIKSISPKKEKPSIRVKGKLRGKSSGHWRSAEDDEKRRTCPICARVFKRYKDVGRHIGSHTKPHLCSHCGKAFSYRYALNNHIKVYHGTENPFRCETCDKSFSCDRSLTVHRLIHTGEKPHKCHICGKAFRQVANLLTHIKLHSADKPFKCSQCEYCSSNRVYLKRHMLTHTSEKKHACLICNKRFLEKPNLSRHMKRHSSVKQHACSICGHRFNERYYLNNHMRIHTKVKPYVCPVCNRAFTMRPNMVSHIKNIHPSYNYKPLRRSQRTISNTTSSDSIHNHSNINVTTIATLSQSQSDSPQVITENSAILDDTISSSFTRPTFPDQSTFVTFSDLPQPTNQRPRGTTKITNLIHPRNSSHLNETAINPLVYPSSQISAADYLQPHTNFKQSVFESKSTGDMSMNATEHQPEHRIIEMDAQHQQAVPHFQNFNLGTSGPNISTPVIMPQSIHNYINDYQLSSTSYDAGQKYFLQDDHSQNKPC